MSTEDLFDDCRKGDITRVCQAVADGVDMRKVVDKSYLNYTPLHYACWYVACEMTKFKFCVPIYRIRYAHEI